MSTGYPIPVFDAAFGGTPGSDYLILGDSVRGLLGTGRLAPEYAGTDLSDDVISFTSHRGRSRPFGPYSAGSGSVVLNDQAGNYNPKNLAGLYVAAGVTMVRPMVLVRFRVEYPEGSGTIYPINAVYAEKWVPSWTLGEAFCTMTGADAFKAFNLNVPSAASVAAGAGDTTGARIGRRLDDHGWSATDRDIDTGKSTVQATTRSGSPLSEMQAVELAEHGYLCMSADNKVVFRDRHSRFEDTVSRTVQATFGDDLDAGELHYDGITPAHDDTQIINRATATIEGGTAQTSENSTSVGRFFPRTDDASGLLLETDIDAARWAEFHVGRYADFDTRIDGLSFTLVPGDYRFATLLGLDIGHRVRVKRRPPDGTTLTFDVFVEEISWTAPKTGAWTCDLSFSSATTFTGFILGTSLLGSTTDLLIAA